MEIFLAVGKVSENDSINSTWSSFRTVKIIPRSINYLVLTTAVSSQYSLVPFLFAVAR